MHFIRLVVDKDLSVQEKEEFRNILDYYNYKVYYMTLDDDGAYKFIIDRHIKDEHMFDIIKNWDDYYEERFFLENSIQPDYFTYEEKKQMVEELMREMHSDFVKKKTDAGWRYGEEFSMENKTSPLLVPFDQLPDNYKDYNPKFFSKVLNILTKKMKEKS